LYLSYHDTEWGVPESIPVRPYEKLVLDGFQAGLSGSPSGASGKIFAKPSIISISQGCAYGSKDITRLLKNEGIHPQPPPRSKPQSGARNVAPDRGKKNPAALHRDDLEHVGGKPLQNRFKNGQIPAQTEMSEGLAKELKQRGFNFAAGHVYALAQASAWSTITP